MAASRRRDPLPLPQLLAKLRTELPAVRARYRVHNLWLFGSYVRGEQRARSDLDVLVEFAETPTLLEYVTLAEELGHIVGVKVDLVSVGALRGNIGQRILNERLLVA